MFKLRKLPIKKIGLKKMVPWFLFLVLLTLISVKILSDADFFNQHRKTNPSQMQTHMPKDSIILPKSDTDASPGIKLPYVYNVSTIPPTVSAKAYLISDLKTGNNIYGKNEILPLPPASVTKIMTAVIALEEYDLSRQIAIPDKCVGINGASVGYKIGEIFTLEDILYGLLVRSGADSACAIANITNESDFISKMNAKARMLGMRNTKFQNEIGFDAQNQHLTTAEDLQILAKHALKFSAFRKIVGTKTVDIRSLNTLSVYKIQNTNDLLFSIPGTVGIKTGSTGEARECLAYLYENKGVEILIILLGSEDRFKDTADLLNWAKTELHEPDRKVMVPAVNQTKVP